MAFNLVDSVKGIFNNEFAAQAATVTGESESGIKTALAGIIPSVLSGLLSQAGSGNSQSIFDMVKGAAGSGILNNLSGALGNGGLLAKGGDLLKGLFGDKLGNVSTLISGFSGIRESSASSLMSIAAPAALGVVGRHVAETNMNAGGLLGFLGTQKENILSSIPSGLNLAGALGLGSLSAIGGKLSGLSSNVKNTVTAGTERVSQAVAVKPKTNWLLLVLGAIAVIALLIFLSKKFNGSSNADVSPVRIDSGNVDSAAVLPLAPIHESMMVKLPDGVELTAYKGGIEDKLVSFLKDPTSKAGKDVWFNFDNLNFETGSAMLTASSQPQVSNITAILKAFPKAKIKIGGYTDKTGDSTANLKLSQARANAVLAALKISGANNSQLMGAEGYGSAFATVAADGSDDDRKTDRRISLGVRDK